MKKFVVFMILIIFSIPFFCLRAYAFDDSDFMYYQTYSSLTGLDLADVPETSYGMTMYDYGIANGVDYNAVKPTSISSADYDAYITGLSSAYIDGKVMDFLIQQEQRQRIVNTGNVMESITGIQSDYWQQTIMDYLTIGSGYGNPSAIGNPVYTIDYGSGSISYQLAGYRLNNPSQYEPVEVMPEPFWGSPAGFYWSLPLYTPDESSAKYPVFRGSAGGVTLLSDSASVVGVGYISAINVVDDQVVDMYNNHLLRVSCEFAVNGSGMYYFGPTFTIKVPAGTSAGDVQISYDGVDLNTIGWWIDDNNTPHSITPSDLIVNPWELKNNGYIDIDGTLYPIYVNFDLDPVISAAIEYCNNYVVNDNPYYDSPYQKPYDNIIDIVRDSSDERDKHLIKIERLLTMLTGKKCECPVWLKKIYELLYEIKTFITSVPSYAIYTTDFFISWGEKTQQYIEGFGVSPNPS